LFEDLNQKLTPNFTIPGYHRHPTMVTLSPLASSEERVGACYGVEVMTTIIPLKSDEQNCMPLKIKRKLQITDYKSISIAIQLWLLFIYWLVVSNICYFP
jgi:hypothetical protein